MEWRRGRGKKGEARRPHPTKVTVSLFLSLEMYPLAYKSRFHHEKGDRGEKKKG